LIEQCGEMLRENRARMNQIKARVSHKSPLKDSAVGNIEGVETQAAENDVQLEKSIAEVYTEMETINNRTIRFFGRVRQLVNDHYGWLRQTRFKQSELAEKSLNESRAFYGFDQRTDDWQTHLEINLDSLVKNVDEKRRRVEQNQTMTKDKKGKKDRVVNDLFLSSLGDSVIVEPLISEAKNRKGEKQTLQESLHTLQNLNRLA